MTGLDRVETNSAHPGLHLTVVTAASAPSCGVLDHSRALVQELRRQGFSAELFVASESEASEIEDVPGGALSTSWDLGGAGYTAGELQKTGRGGVILFQYVPHLYGRSGISAGAALFPWLARRRGFKVATHFHEVCAPWSLNPVRSAVALAHRIQAWLLIKGSDAVTFSTSRYAGLMRLPLCIFRRPSAVLPSGPTSPPVELSAQDRCELRSRWCSKEQHLGVIYGLASRAKRYDLAMEALKLLHERDIAINLLMLGDQEAGDAAYCGEIRDAAARMGLAARVSWSGRVSPEEVSRTLAACDFMWHLNSGGLTLRSGAAASAFGQELPIIAFARQGLDDCFRDGENVILVKRQDAHSLADATARLLLSEDLRSRLQSGARSLKEQMLSWPAIAEAHLRLFRKVGIKIV